MPPIRVRFAPSPTGHLHIGSARTALFNWLFARHHHGTFLLRIEDTDLVRSSNDYLEAILDDLAWLGLDWDEGPGVGGDFGPYVQTEREGLYRNYAQTLLNSGQAYYCYCTPAELAAGRDAAQEDGVFSGYPGTCRNRTLEEQEALLREGRKRALRFRVQRSDPILIDDLIRGQVCFEPGTLDDFIIVKSDGIPVYNFAAVVDDALMRISHVIRGEEHLSNTPRQMLLYEALKLPAPCFAHLPIILDTDRSKLSKREGATRLGDFRQRGFLPEALVNFLALLGWSPGGDREIIHREEIVELFDLPRITSHPAIFDLDKLEWMNGQYLKSLDQRSIAHFLFPLLEAKGLLEPARGRGDEWLHSFIGLYRERFRTLDRLAEEAALYLQEDLEYDPEAVARHLNPPPAGRYLADLERCLASLTDFEPQSLETAIRGQAAALGISASKLIHPLRVACTGRAVSPGIFDTLSLLGRQMTLKRIESARAMIEQGVTDR